MSVIRLLAVGAVATAACVEGGARPVDVVVPAAPVEVSRVSAAECTQAEQVCGNTIGRECGGVSKGFSCVTHCADGSGRDVDGGVFVSETCGNCFLFVGAICGKIERVGQDACALLRQCEDERRAVKRP